MNSSRQFNTSTNGTAGGNGTAGPGVGDDTLKFGLLTVTLTILQVGSGLAGSVLVLVTFFQNRSLRSPFNYLIVNHCFIDFVVFFGGCGFVFNMFAGPGYLGKHFCTDIWIYVQLLLIYGAETAVYVNHLAIMCNRAWALFFPMHYRTHNSGKVTKTLCVIPWVVALVAVLPVMIWNDIYYPIPEPITQCTVFADGCPYLVMPFFVAGISSCFLVVGTYPILWWKNRQRRRSRVGHGLAVGNLANGTRRDHQSGRPVVIADGSEASNFLLYSWISISQLIFQMPFMTLNMLGTSAVTDNLSSAMFYISTYVDLWASTGIALEPWLFIFTLPLLDEGVKRLLWKSFACLSTRQRIRPMRNG